MAVHARVHTSDDEQRASSHAQHWDHVVDGADEKGRDALARAIGEELRRAREAHGWSRTQLSRQLSSGNGDRTLLAYEHGVRRLLLQKLVELCVVLRVDPGTIVTRGLARAQLYLENLTLHVDLNALLGDNGRGGTFGPMRQWARNTLNEHPNGIVQVEPAVVRNLALFIGCSHKALTAHLARFTPEIEIHEDTSTPTDSRPNAPGITRTANRFRETTQRQLESADETDLVPKQDR